VLEQQMVTLSLLGAEWVLWLLVILSVVVVGVAVERGIYAAANRSPAAPLESALQAFLSGGPASALVQALHGMNGIEARVLSRAAEAGARGGLHSAEQAIAGALAHERVQLDRGLVIIGTVGSNAPFLGLFGTVLGIIQAFHNLALDADEGGQAVMAGISEALVATAVGLLVAIPAVVLYNWFQRRNKEQLARVTSLGHFVLSRFADAPGARAEGA
jgi:biopolymer transport protein ExbB